MEMPKLFQDYNMVSFLSTLFFILTFIIIAKIIYRIKLVTESPELFEKDALFFCILSLVFAMVFQASVEPIIEVTMELTNNRLLLALSPLPLLILLVISFKAGAGYVNSDKAWVSQFQSKAELFEHLKNQREKEQSKLAQKYKDY